MRGIRLRSTLKSVVAILCTACFVTMSLGSVSRAVAADTWETWPKKGTEPGVETTPPATTTPPTTTTPPATTEPSGAATAGDTAGKKPSTGISGGTIGWIALGAAAVIGIAIAAGSGGGGGGGGTTSNH